MEDGGRNVQTLDAYGNFDSNKETYKIWWKPNRMGPSSLVIGSYKAIHRYWNFFFLDFAVLFRYSCYFGSSSC